MSNFVYARITKQVEAMTRNVDPVPRIAGIKVGALLELAGAGAERGATRPAELSIFGEKF